ncbi:glycosyltransferase [Pseudomonas sp. MWU12-2115]|uniref:glycosyltransferase n=1 Tax=unclassified Pseudomonas TaxID=196821 RepID=UPI000CD55FC8|nr:glycosyltransferase [Pseudomonas sp. MWU12-2020]RBC03504.1 glycosyltransferase [Pseudomonas sp. MWU12-2115]
MKKPTDDAAATGEVNSKTYWDHRFSSDWEENFGREQSIFFSNVAADNFPSWLTAQIKDQHLTMCDWGCAQGDGTQNLAKRLSLPDLVGVDFSSEAIAKASAAYPEYRFVCDDFLGESSDAAWDVLFSSNTLEHFASPWTVLEQIRARAKKFIVLLLPFREQELIDEHFYSFDFDNVPASVGNWALTHSSIVDTSQHEPNYWRGEQILLIYSNLDNPQGTQLHLSNLNIDAGILRDLNSRIMTQRQRLEQEHAEFEEARRNLELRQAELMASQAETEARLNASLQDNQACVEAHKITSDQLKLVEAQYRQLINSHSWKLTKPLRLATRLARHGLSAGDKRALKNKLRSIYHKLPLPAAVKRGLRQSYSKVVEAPISVVKNQLLDGNTFKLPTLRPAPQEKGLADYIFWGVIDWHFRHQRPQQLAQALAGAGRRVFYISVNLVDDPRPGFNVEQLDTQGRLFQINLYAKGAPVIYTTAPGVDIADQLKGSIGQVLDWAGTRQIVSLIQHPFWYETSSMLPDSELVYDCMDHHEGFGNVSEEVLSIERALMRNADITITTSTWLDEIVSQHTQNRVLIRNAGEFEHFAARPADVYVDPQQRKIIGYYGAIAEWFDLDLLESVAKAFPQHSVLMIGADTVGARARLAHLSNVTFTGEMPYSELPKYLHAFDVCLLPFQVIPLTLATNPVKVYEYLSAGKPVVSVDLPEIKQFENLVHAAATTDDFIKAIAEEIEAPDAAERIPARQNFARNQTWGHRAEQMIQRIEHERTVPRVSVIVVTYNNIELTKACLTSLEENTNHENLEIIVVDNASADGTPALLSEWVTQGENRKIILNEDNRGFAAGNNQGLAIADGEYLVLLNNDTFVTPGWIRTLYRHLERNKTIGIIGPVTNNIGNEAKIQISYQTMDEMLVESGKYTHSHIGKLQNIQTAAFFCVMFSRQTYEAVGPLDEAFGRGFFEDDDYCRRVEQLGLSIACAEDVFIHHHLSASFNKLRSADRQALFEQNKATYEAKWGTWTPHSYKNVEKK